MVFHSKGGPELFSFSISASTSIRKEGSFFLSEIPSKVLVFERKGLVLVLSDERVSCDC